jgi:phosphoserine aminotransferase
VPKLYRLAKNRKFLSAVFEGDTINTPSMLCAEDALDAMAWARSVGGTAGLERRTRANAKVVYDWIARTPWLQVLAVDPRTLSPTSVCMRLSDAYARGLDREAQAKVFAGVVGALDQEGVAYDINSYRDAPPGLRIWCGSTVESADLAILTEWLDWAWSVHGLPAK